MWFRDFPLDFWNPPPLPPRLSALESKKMVTPWANVPVDLCPPPTWGQCTRVPFVFNCSLCFLCTRVSDEYHLPKTPARDTAVAQALLLVGRN